MFLFLLSSSSQLSEDMGCKDVFRHLKYCCTIKCNIWRGGEYPRSCVEQFHPITLSIRQYLKNLDGKKTRPNILVIFMWIMITEPTNRSRSLLLFIPLFVQVYTDPYVCFVKGLQESRKISLFVHLESLFTYLLTPWSRVLLEKLTGSAASQEIPRIFGTRRFITVFTRARHLSLS